MSTNEIESLQKEKRFFKPPTEFSKTAAVKSMEEYKKLYDYSVNHFEDFWRTQAQAQLVWEKPFSQVLTWNEPIAKFFEDGRLNASVQCLDKNLEHHKNKMALIWEGEPGDTRSLTYEELFESVCRVANTLKTFGIKKGDRVAIYLPMIPEAVISMLACARLGAAHTVIFGGFSSEALKERIIDCQCKAVITADGGYRRGQVIPLKENVDRALEHCPSVEKVLVVERTKNKVAMKKERDFWWHERTSKESVICEPEIVESENLLFILYTSGTTGKPKGIVHSTAGYLLSCALTTQWVFDLKPEDIYWCTADIGWVTGHSYVVYGPLQCGATVFMYEGAPNFPDFSRYWKLIDKHRVSIFYTAPTAIRAFMKAGMNFVKPSRLDSLRLLGSVGEPINPEAWMWYHKNIGREKCPIVDTWWQTETGSIMMSPLPGATPTKPGSCAFPLPGVVVSVRKKTGEVCEPNEGGFLVIEKPWPSMSRGIYNDLNRFTQTYWSDFKGKYFAGDGARVDEDGYFWVMGRVDDVLNVAGHRLSTAEVESALVSHPKVAEAAVVGRPDDLKGQAIVAFVTLKTEFQKENLEGELKAHVAKEIGAIAKPDEIKFTESLPKTRSGKIMRRLLREIAAHGKITGDVTTLEDMNIVNTLTAAYAEED